MWLGARARGSSPLPDFFGVFLIGFFGIFYKSQKGASDRKSQPGDKSGMLPLPLRFHRAESVKIPNLDVRTFTATAHARRYAQT